MRSILRDSAARRRIVELRHRGYSIQAIAASQGVAVSTVTRVLAREGMTRPSSRREAPPDGSCRVCGSAARRHYCSRACMMRGTSRRRRGRPESDAVFEAGVRRPIARRHSASRGGSARSPNSRAELACIHHWLIESPHGERTVSGTCRDCGEVRTWPASLDASGWEGGTAHHDLFEPTATARRDREYLKSQP